MSKTINFLNKVAFAIVTILVLISTATVVRAEDENTDVTEPEKELVLYNADGDIDGDGLEDLWVGFRYENSEEKTCLEIFYNDKSLTSLIEEGYTVEYRYFNEYPTSTSWIDWYPISDLDIYDKTLYLSDGGDGNIYQFRLLNTDGNIVSTSDRLVTDTKTTSFPIILSSIPYNYDYYDLDGKSVQITLKYNDNLVLKDTTEKEDITISPLNPLGSLDSKTPYFITNFKYTNHSEILCINGKDYIWNYCLVTFYCNFAHYELTNIDYNPLLTSYQFNLKNLIGKRYITEACPFYYNIYSYKASTLTPQKKLVINNHENRLEVDETTQLSTEVLSDEISTDGLMWVSSDENIAKVDENGVVTATGLGRAYIYATKEDTIELYDYCIVDVVENIPVSNISLDVSTLALKTGEEHQFIVAVEPENALDKTVTWTSSDETIVAVNENGLVTAKSAGTAVITATSNYDKSISISCIVTVTDPISKAKSITITGIPKVIKYNSSFRLTAIIAPSDAMNNKITWKSSNTKYAAIDSRGNVTIKPAGVGKSVKITAKAQDGSGVSKTVTLKIRPNTVKVTKLKIKSSKTKITAGKSVKLKVVITPSNAANKKVTWKSSNTKYATVNSKGVVVTKKAGRGKTVKITAILKDNSKAKATITLKIK